MSNNSKFSIGIIALAWAALFGGVFLRGHIFFLDDLKIIYYPLEAAYAQFQHAWQLPVWSNYFGFGQPLLAWGQLGFFTPLHVLLRALYIHPLTLLQISVAAYFAVGLAGMYWFLRLRSFSALAASLGAIIYVFGGFSIGHLNHVNFYTGTMVLPLLLVAVLVFIRRPTPRQTSYLILASSAIAVSAQPQVVLLSFIVAGLYGGLLLIEQKPARARLTKTLALVSVAGVVAFSLSSLSILPLQEFVPQTERGEDLSREELLEFSYPPFHAITLVLPYFYGDHDSYWGAKGFQELAAFTGIIPLILAGGALSLRRKYKTEWNIAVILILVALAMALGRYSPIYRYIVEHLLFSSFAVASRFVYFFDIGIAILAACGIDAIYTRTISKRFTGYALAFAVCIFLPFTLRLFTQNPELSQLTLLAQSFNRDVIIGVAGIFVLCLAPFWLRKKDVRAHTHLAFALTVLSAATLIVFAWEYNPTVQSRVGFQETEITDYLLDVAENNEYPRLYSRPKILQGTDGESALTRYTDHISPNFSVYQPVMVPNSQRYCVSLPLELNADGSLGDITVSLLATLTSRPIESKTIALGTRGSAANEPVCFDISTLSSRSAVLSLTATSDSSVTVRYRDETDPQNQVYFVRVVSPTEDQLSRSRKPYAIDFEYIDADTDSEFLLLARHLNSVVSTSSARWIGALSIKPYREYIEQFFANDRDNPFTGGGEHFIQQYRTIFNMSSVNYLTQLISPDTNDLMQNEGYQVVAETAAGDATARLYKNPDAFEKAFMVPQAQWISAADETRFAMSQPGFDPRKTVFISGPQPLDQFIESEVDTSIDNLSYSANITRYTQTEIEITTQSNEPGYLILTDATTPEWHTSIDGIASPYLVANSIFKAAYVPAGDHVVTFTYSSPATNRAVYLTIFGVIATVVLLTIPQTKNDPR